MSTDMHSVRTAAGRTDERRRRSLWRDPALTTALILLIPLLANYLVDGWHWDLRGFVLVGALLFGTGVTYELVTRNVDAIAYRAAVGVALVAAFLVVWFNFVQAADDVNPAAVWYFWVPIVGITGAATARFQPDGMARALFATALAQTLVLVMALITRDPRVTSWTSAVSRGFGLNALFVMLFLGSASLFRTAARKESAPGAV